MDKNMNKLIRTMMDVEYCPPSQLIERNVDLSLSQKFPIAEAAALGVAFEPLGMLINFAKGGAGKSGLYWVNTKGKTMFKSGTKYIGGLKDINGAVGGGQSRMTPVAFNPAMLSMAIVFMTVGKKLDNIQEVQKEILAFLELKEEARLKGNLNTLADVLNNYKYNWGNEKYKNNKHILVQDIKRESEQSIILYRDQISKTLDKKALFRVGKDIKNQLSKMLNRLNDYQLALYIFSFSSFLEVMLLENFDTNYLKSATNKIIEYAENYSVFFEKCSEKIETDSKGAVEGYALRGLSRLCSGTGKIVEKIPVISKSQFEETLIKAGEVLQDVDVNRTKNAMDVLADSQTDYIGAFVENIKVIDVLYNTPTQLMFDAEYIYVTQEDSTK